MCGYGMWAHMGTRCTMHQVKVRHMEEHVGTVCEAHMGTKCTVHQVKVRHVRHVWVQYARHIWVRDARCIR